MRAVYKNTSTCVYEGPETRAQHTPPHTATTRTLRCDGWMDGQAAWRMGRWPTVMATGGEGGGEGWYRMQLENGEDENKNTNNTRHNAHSTAAFGCCCCPVPCNRPGQTRGQHNTTPHPPGEEKKHTTHSTSCLREKKSARTGYAVYDTDKENGRGGSKHGKTKRT